MNEHIEKIESLTFNKINKSELKNEILQIYINEFEDYLFENILIKKESEFMLNLSQRMRLVINDKFKSEHGENNIDYIDSDEETEESLNFLIKKIMKECEIEIYRNFYKKHVNILKVFNFGDFSGTNENGSSKSQGYFRFRKHCRFTDDIPRHNCRNGKNKNSQNNENSSSKSDFHIIYKKEDNTYHIQENFYDFNDSAQNHMSNFDINSITHIICRHCNKCYFLDSVLLYCNFCSIPYYSSIEPFPDDKINSMAMSLQPATWEKYHCSAIVNDQMHCIKCDTGPLFLHMKENMVICINEKCKFKANPSTIFWNCMICNEEFKSNAKIYNPLEYKMMRQTIREALLSKTIALPIKNCCDNANSYTSNNLTYTHKKECSGTLYQGLLYDRKVVVCSKCKTMNNFDKFVWTCPVCNKRFSSKKEVRFSVKEGKEDYYTGNHLNKINPLSTQYKDPSDAEESSSIKNSNSNPNRSFGSASATATANPQSSYKGCSYEKNTQEKTNAFSSQNSYSASRNSENSKSSPISIKMQNLNLNPKSKENTVNSNNQISDSNYFSERKLKFTPVSLNNLKNRNFNINLNNNKLNFSSSLNTTTCENKEIEKIDVSLGNSEEVIDQVQDEKNKNLKHKSSGNLFNVSHQKNYLDPEAEVNSPNDFEMESNPVLNLISVNSKSIQNIVSRNQNVDDILKIREQDLKEVEYSQEQTTENKDKSENSSNYNKDENIFENKIEEIQENNIINLSFQNFEDHEAKNLEILSSPQFNNQDYEITTQIGEGSFGKIYECINKNTNKKFAMKKIILHDSKDLIKINNEFKIMMNLFHENILKISMTCYKELDITTNVIYLLMDLGRLDWEKEILTRQKIQPKKFYKEIELINIIKQVNSALSYLQINSIAHRDVKPQNIIIFSQESYKLADFGEAQLEKYQENTCTSQTSYQESEIIGTELFMSPTLYFNFKKFEKKATHNTFKSDVFSLGLCMLYASSLSLNPVYEIREIKILDLSQESLNDCNIKMKRILNTYLKMRFSKGFLDLISILLEFDENDRPDFLELEEILQNY